MANVIIGCKIPNGYILEIIPLPDKDPAKQRRNPAPTGPRVTLAGSYSLRKDPTKALGQYDYALTSVDGAFWEKWYAHAGNKDLDVIKNGLIFVAQDAKEAQGMSRDRAELKTGLEPLSPKVVDDPRLPRGNQLAAEPRAS